MKRRLLVGLALLSLYALIISAVVFFVNLLGVKFLAIILFLSFALLFGTAFI